MKISFKLITVLGFIVCQSTQAIAQHQEREVLLYNTSFGAITSAIGAVINKPKNTNWKKAFLKGAWQGSIGGFINYCGKKTLYQINKSQNDFAAFPARILHSAGNSIVENAALNEPFLKNWHLNYGPVRLDFSFKGTFKVRFLPEIIYSTIRTAPYGKFDFKKSLASGVLVFKTEYPLSFQGVSHGRSILYTTDKNLNPNPYQITAHEYVHTFQFDDFQVFNAWLNPIQKKVKSKFLRRMFTDYIYFDAPYVLPFYELEGRYPNNRYFRNFFEFEAQRFSTNRHVNFRR